MSGEATTSKRPVSSRGGRLRRTWARIESVPGLRKDVLTVAVVAVVGVAVALTLVSKQLGGVPWAGGRQTVEAEFAQAVAINLSKRQDVRVAGVPVGRITDVKPTGKGTAIVSLSIDENVTVHRDATAALRPMNPLNEMYVALDPGTPAAARLGPEETIPATQTTTPTQIDDVLSHLDDRAQSALTNLLAEGGVGLADAEKTLPAGLSAADQTLARLEPIVSALQVRREKISTLVTSLSQITDAVGSDDTRLAHLLDAAQTVLGTVAAKDEDVRATLNRLPQVAADLRGAMASTTELTAQLNPLLDNLGKSSKALPDALNKVDDLLDAVDDTLPKAKPVVKGARPVIADLRPVVPDLDSALTDLRPVTQRLDGATRLVVDELPGIAAFVYNSAGLTVARDKNGTMVRGQLTINVRQPFGTDANGCLPLPSYLPCIKGAL